MQNLFQPSPDCSERRIGTLGEIATLGYLTAQNYEADLIGGNLPFDVLMVDHEGQPIRIQVKTTNRMYRRKDRRRIKNGVMVENNPFYRFNTAKGGSSNESKYSKRDIDIMCFMALQTMDICFIPVSGVSSSKIDFRIPGITYTLKTKRANTFDMFPLDKALERVKEERESVKILSQPTLNP